MADQLYSPCFKNHFITSSKLIFCLIFVCQYSLIVIFSMDSEPKCKLLNNFVIPNNFHYLFRMKYCKKQRNIYSFFNFLREWKQQLHTSLSFYQSYPAHACLSPIPSLPMMFRLEFGQVMSIGFFAKARLSILYQIHISISHTFLPCSSSLSTKVLCFGKLCLSKHFSSL